MAYTEEQMADFQRLSIEFVPKTKGPLVSLRQSSDHITAEYAQADPVYVQKTKALARTFSSYRTLRGDGNCGWRALAFGYMEGLLYAADPSRIMGEVARLKSLNNLLDSVGYEQHVYEGFVEETFGLLSEIANMSPNDQNNAALVARFTQDGVSESIITHFRIVTSAWLKTHADAYAPYLANPSINGIESYCSSAIETFAVEIDNVGLQACVDALIKPAGLAVQVLYLDRSPGEQVNDHWPAENANATHTVRLLYRPGHYDMVYKRGDVDEIPSATVFSPQINTVFDPLYMSTSNSCYSHQGLDLNNFYLPGLASAGIASVPLSTSSYPTNPTCAPFSPSLTPAATDVYLTPAYCPPPRPVTASPPVQDLLSSGGFRPSKFQIEKPFRDAMTLQMEPCQTEAMKQAGESPAHFNNERFQPQMWEPDASYKTSGRNSSEPRRRSS